MSTNLYVQFRKTLNESVTLVAKVIEHRTDGRTSLIEFPTGSRTIAQGQTVDVNAHCFVRNGEIIGKAPGVTPVTIDV